jgi:UDP-N-acetylmuramyl pentapeptide phosphotransferase/UDP-N-acetylglucosamine-1-phosphate transferase
MIFQNGIESALPALVAAGVSLLVTLALLLTQRWHAHLSLDQDSGIQKFHTQATPRVGGLPVLLGVLVAWTLMPAKLQTLLTPMLLAAIPAFGSGFIEDITKTVGVRTRLICTIGSGVLASLLTGYSVANTGVWGLDWLLSFGLVSLLFTALSIGTMANAINMIDGFNGLSAGSLIIMFVGMALIAAGAGDQELILLSLVLASAVLGFAVLNWPMGKIFLGDGGAYFAGFVLGWIGVALTARNPGISSWAPIMVCAYPVLELFFSIARRRKRRHSPGQADRLHLHSLVRRRITGFLLPRASALSLNSVTGVLMWPASLLSTTWAVVYAKDSTFLVVGLVVSGLIYHLFYRMLVRFKWGSKRRTGELIEQDR